MTVNAQEEIIHQDLDYYGHSNTTGVLHLFI